MAVTEQGVIRPVAVGDVAALKGVIDACGLFPSEMMDGMLEPYLQTESAEGEFWLTYDDGGPVAVAYYAPERMTEGRWNLYLIAVTPARQGNGVGAALLLPQVACAMTKDGRLRRGWCRSVGCGCRLR